MTDGYDFQDLASSYAFEAPPFDPDERDGPSDPIGGHAVNWRTITDEDAAGEWMLLRAWVEWFTTRYNIPLSTIPNCWWRHDGLVEELSALHTAWVASFDESDAGLGPIGWHERLAIARGRWREVYTGGCSQTHRDDTVRTWTDVIDETEWTTHTGAPAPGAEPAS